MKRPRIQKTKDNVAEPAPVERPPEEEKGREFWRLFDQRELAAKLESIGKLSAIAVAILYLIGLLIFGLYYSGLHIRSIELFRVRYIFVGFYFVLLTLVHLVIPQFFLKRWWLKILYVLFMPIPLIMLDEVFRRYIQYKLQRWASGSSPLQFSPVEIQIVTGNLIALVASALASPPVFFLVPPAFRYVYSAARRLAPLALGLLLFVLANECSIFITFMFPNIPEALGGGSSPIVQIEFNEKTPYSIKSTFDISIKAHYPGSPYWGRLIYSDGGSLFLKEAAWYSTNVYEIKREYVDSLQYSQFNPAEMGNVE